MRCRTILLSSLKKASSTSSAVNFAGSPAVERSDRGLLDLRQLRVAGHLLGEIVGLRDGSFRLAAKRLGELGILGSGGPGPARLAGLGDQFLDGADGGLHLLMAEHDRAEHHFLGQARGLRLHHQHRMLGAGDDQVQLRIGERLGGRVEDVGAVLVADARSTNRPIERQAREAHGGRGADQRGDVRIDLRIERDDGGHHLHVVVEAIREQRADRAVDQARGEGLLLRRPALALEEPARDAPGGVGLLDVIHREREEVPARGGGRLGAGGDEHDGLAHGDAHRAFCLAGHLARLDRY